MFNVTIKGKFEESGKVAHVIETSLSEYKIAPTVCDLIFFILVLRVGIADTIRIRRICPRVIAVFASEFSCECVCTCQTKGLFTLNAILVRFAVVRNFIRFLT